MQSIEVIVFFVFAVLVGIMVIGFLTGFDFLSMQENLFKVLKGEPSGTKVTYSQFINQVSNCWSACEYGKQNRDCGLYHLKVEEEKDYGKKVTITGLKKDFNKFNICRGCEISMNPSELILPTTVKIGCKTRKGKAGAITIES